MQKFACKLHKFFRVCILLDRVCIDIHETRNTTFSCIVFRTLDSECTRPSYVCIRPAIRWLDVATRRSYSCLPDVRVWRVGWVIGLRWSASLTIRRMCTVLYCAGSGVGGAAQQTRAAACDGAWRTCQTGAFSSPEHFGHTVFVAASNVIFLVYAPPRLSLVKRVSSERFPMNDSGVAQILVSASAAARYSSCRRRGAPFAAIAAPGRCSARIPDDRRRLQPHFLRCRPPRLPPHRIATPVASIMLQKR